MKLTKSNVMRVKKATDSPLEKRVCNYVLDEWNNYSDKKYIFTDVLYHGCQTGVVGFLVYYSDTVRFYKQYREEIDNLLYDLMGDLGTDSMSALFGDRWDKEDPLGREDYNQNLLAWFGFEETLRNIAYKFDELQEAI